MTVPIVPGSDIAHPLHVEIDRATSAGLDAGDVQAFPLWYWIKNRAEATLSPNHISFINRALCFDPELHPETPDRLTGLEVPVSGNLREQQQRLGMFGTDAYRLLKLATETFLLLHSGAATVHPPIILNRDGMPEPAEVNARDLRLEGVPSSFAEIHDALVRYLGDDNSNYISTILRNAGIDPANAVQSPFCGGVLAQNIHAPCLLELIWSYWHEEGMLVQTLTAIARRFQNMRSNSNSDRDPLTELEIDPLRPLNNFLWGYIQDEVTRLSVVRRAYEYDHHYGLTLHGKAVPPLRPADSRSKFLHAFHSLLHDTAMFYRDEADTTVRADGFPLLNALKEVHLLLAQGAHNQYRDLPWTARVEMLIQQWLLSRPEMREFLRGRFSVPYPEPWMGAVDAMKRLQGWDDASVRHFRDLGVFGERILLSIRFTNWSNILGEGTARAWAQFWKPEIQGYIHAYRAVTGVDLTTDLTSRTVDATLPAIHLQRRLAEQRRNRR